MKNPRDFETIGAVAFAVLTVLTFLTTLASAISFTLFALFTLFSVFAILAFTLTLRELAGNGLPIIELPHDTLHLLM